MRSLMMKRKVKKVFDYSKLRGKIKEVFGTQAKFAKAMGMSTVTFLSMNQKPLKTVKNRLVFFLMKQLSVSILG